MTIPTTRQSIGICFTIVATLGVILSMALGSARPANSQEVENYVCGDPCPYEEINPVGTGQDILPTDGCLFAWHYEGLRPEECIDKEETTKKWAAAIAQRISDEWEGRAENEEDANLLEEVLYQALKTRPEITSRLVGTTIIEENYFNE